MVTKKIGPIFPLKNLYANEEYNYTIRTGVYPQIHHADALPTTNGGVNRTQFIDTNGKRYSDWIPAIRLALYNK